MKKFTGIAGFVNWAIDQKKVVYILVIALVITGIFGLNKMKKNEFPDFEIEQGLVAGVYPGASAAEVEEQLTKPLEETLFSFPEVNRKYTKSVTKDGICYIYVDLKCKQSRKNEMWSKIKLSLQARKATLPTGVLDVVVLDDFSSVSSILLAIESNDKSYAELQDYADRLCDRLREMPDLAKVSIIGKQNEEIAVTLDREKLSSYGIDPTLLFLNYQTSGLNIPSGSFQTDYVTAPIHIASTVGSEREINDKIVYSDPGGNVLRLKDIADVQRRYKTPGQFVSYNGHTCLILDIQMRNSKNIVAFGHKVDRILADYSKDLPASVKMSRISDKPKVVGTYVFSFLKDLLLSMLVVILVMLLLFPMKSALIASSGLPIITAITIAVMYMTGMDLNTVTLAALIVVLGMIVDDSIITMDGYINNLGKGLGKKEAACASAKELFAPTFTATLAICTMFFPIKYIIPGYLGSFVKLFPWVVAISLMTSLIYAVTVVPSLEVKFISEPTSKRNNVISRMQNRFFKGIANGYEKAQAFCFRKPKLTLLFGLVAVGLGVLMFSRINIQMMPLAARDYFVVEMELEGGKGIKDTKALSDSLERIFRKDPRIESVTSFIGTGAPRFSATYSPILPSPTTAQIIVNTKSSKATEEVLHEYESKYEHIFPEALIRFKHMDYQAVDAPVLITLKGEDRTKLVEAADSIKKYMYSLSDELMWIHTDCEDFEPSVDITLDNDEAARLGVNKTLLSLSLASTFNGQTITNIWEGDKKIPVNLYSKGVTGNMDYEDIGNQMVNTSIPGISVPLRQVASISPDWTPRQLDRNSGSQSVSVYADMRYEQSQPVAMRKIRKYIEKDIRPKLPKGTEIVYGGLTSLNKYEAPYIAWSFLAAVSILFLFMLFHFKKFSIAFLTLITSTLCLFGASFGLWIFGLDFSLTAVLGLISLVGIIVRNGILMFEYAEDLRFKQGVDVKTASMEAGKRRMRPISLTSCTTALGVLPMVIRGDLLWKPMGVVICFGTLLSIFLIVLIMPVAYWQLFKNAPKLIVGNEEK